MALSLRGLSKNEKELISRKWGNIPIVDATEKLRLFVSKEDIAQSIRKDFSSCALANCCKRSIGSEGVFFYKTRAYVHIPTSKQIQRFILNKSGQELISSFDKGKSIKSQEVVLTPPKEFQKLDSELERQRWIRRKEKGLTGHAKKDNELRGTKPKKVKPVKPKGTSVVRSGRGKVSFTVGSATGKAPK